MDCCWFIGAAFFAAFVWILNIRRKTGVWPWQETGTWRT